MERLRGGERPVLGMSEACRIAPRLSGGISRLSARFVPVSDEVGRGPRLFVTPRHVKFMEMEYSVPAAAMRPVLLEMKRLFGSGSGIPSISRSNADM